MKKQQTPIPMFARYLETPELTRICGGASTVEVSELGPKKLANSSTARNDSDYDD